MLLHLKFIYFQATPTEDLYWEGEDDLANEFLEVDASETGLGRHLQRLKRFALGKLFVFTFKAPAVTLQFSL